MISQELIRLSTNDDIAQMTEEEKYQLLLDLEVEADVLLKNGDITQEEAWDIYFGLLHTCDDEKFFEDRPRILAKIDTKNYHPFKSSCPEVIFLARLRAIGMGLLAQN